MGFWHFAACLIDLDSDHRERAVLRLSQQAEVEYPAGNCRLQLILKIEPLFSYRHGGKNRLKETKQLGFNGHVSVLRKIFVWKTVVFAPKALNAVHMKSSCTSLNAISHGVCC